MLILTTYNTGFKPYRYLPNCFLMKQQDDEKCDKKQHESKRAVESHG